MQYVIFTCKLQKSDHFLLKVKGTCVTQSKIQKNLGMLLDSKLDFKEHIQNVLNKFSKKIGWLFCQDLL